MMKSGVRILVTRVVPVVMCLLLLSGSIAGCGIIDEVGWQSEPSESDDPNDPERDGDWLRPDRSERSSQSTASSPDEGD